MCSAEVMGQRARFDPVAARRRGLRGHGDRAALARERPGRERAQGQAAHQGPRVRYRREHPAHPADPHDAGAGDRVHRRRRTGRGYPGEPAHPQEVPGGTRAQEGLPRLGVIASVNAKRSARSVHPPGAFRLRIELWRLRWPNSCYPGRSQLACWGGKG
ncbi:hypothetical protein TVD_01410 [Thioalkalivibrio versutus]|uniref:Uncharacterized protein n=1 Tax=Thioalkalivibrio versutus TaxID=106634 RepID=A0A0G3FYU3_9GAMM|nr:hypothetical protein TVD_01410 [Thioalkalivibrio versutus]